MAAKLIGNLNQYGKILKMQQQWSEKKSNPGLITSKADLNRSLVEALSPRNKKYSLDEIHKKVEDMKSKLRAGRRLTPEEKKFLAENAPDVYRDVVAVEKEREAFSARLRACKSKQQVQSAKMEKTTQILATTTKENADLGTIRMAQMDAAAAELASFFKELPDHLDEAENEKQEDAAVSDKTERSGNNAPEDIPSAEEIVQELAAQLGGVSYSPQMESKIAEYVSVPPQEGTLSGASGIFSSGRAAYCAAAESPAKEEPAQERFHRKA